jgi:hypothetical protein
MGKWKYRPRLADAARIEQASFPTVEQITRIGGFDPDFLWPESRKLAAKMIGNSVAPPQAAQVMIAAQRAGLLVTHYRARPALKTATQVDLRVEAKALKASVKNDPAWNRMPLWTHVRWAEAAETARLAAMGAHKRWGHQAASKPTHPDAMWPPRRAQAPWLA